MIKCKLEFDLLYGLIFNKKSQPFHDWLFFIANLMQVDRKLVCLGGFGEAEKPRRDKEANRPID
jgi:hypothetical protein